MHALSAVCKYVCVAETRSSQHAQEWFAICGSMHPGDRIVNSFWILSTWLLHHSIRLLEQTSVKSPDAEQIVTVECCTRGFSRVRWVSG